MSPYERARELYKDDLETFYEIIDKCGQYGAFHSDENCFVCAYQTYSESIKNKTQKRLDTLDTWYIYILAGDPKRAFGYTDKKMKYIAYERFDGNVRLIESDKIENLLWRTQLRGQDPNEHKFRFEIGV